MAMLSPQDRQAVQERLSRELVDKVTLKLFTQQTLGLSIPGRECPTCGQTQELLQELVDISPQLELEVRDFYRQPEEARAAGVERIPAIVMGRDGQGNLKYYGIPLGYEFATILEGIAALSQGRSPLKPETQQRLREVDQDVHIQVFVTPT